MVRFTRTENVMSSISHRLGETWVSDIAFIHSASLPRDGERRQEAREPANPQAGLWWTSGTTWWKPGEKMPGRSSNRDELVVLHMLLVGEILKGSLSGVERWLQRGASTHGAHAACPHPLEMAAHLGHVDIVKHLVGAGANLEEASSIVKHQRHGGRFSDRMPRKGSRPLHGACYGGWPDACRVLLDLGADSNSVDVEGFTPLMAACVRSIGEEKSLALVRHLLRAGANPSQRNSKGAIALHLAAMSGYTASVRMLLSAAPDTLNHPEESGSTALVLAALGGEGPTLSFLLAAGVNDEAKCMAVGTALVNAIVHGQDSVVGILLEEGLQAIGGKLAVELAIPEAMRRSVEHERVRVLQQLLDVQDGENRLKWAKPMIHYAAGHCSLRSVHVLLSAGADATEDDFQGATAKDCIGTHLPQDKRDPKKMAAVGRMLARGPAFRACSWTWPSATTSLGTKAPRLGVRVYRPTTSKSKRASKGITRG